MDERRTFSSLVLQFTLAANLCTFFYLMTLSTRTPNGYYPLSMLVYSPAVYLLNKLFLSRPQTMRRLVLLNTAVGALFFLSILLLGEQKEMLLLVFAAGFCLWITMKGGYRSLHAPTLHEMILSLDTSAVMLVLLMGYTSIMGSGILWVLPGAAGFAAACLGVAARRMYGPITIKGWALLGIAFVGIFGLMVLLVGVAAAPAGEGIVMLWNGLVTLAKGVLALLWRLLLFFSSLLPEMAAGDLEEPYAQIQLPEEELVQAEANPVLTIILLVLASVALLLFLAWLLRLMGRLKIGGRKVPKAEKVPQRRRISLWSGLKRLLESWRTRIRLHLFLTRHRDTPVGMFYGLVRRCRLSPWRKRTGETPREFLLRLRRSAGEDLELAAALDGLIPAVETALYSPVGRSDTVAQAGLIRRRIGRAVRGQFLRDSWSSVRRLRKPGVDKGTKL